MNRIVVALFGIILLGVGCLSGEQGANVDVLSDSDFADLVAETRPEDENRTQTDTPTEDQDTFMKDVDYTFPGVLPAEEIEGKQVRITTDKGDIVFELFPETAPNTVSNFVYLTKEGFYDGVRFHRREEGFVIQGGDPQSRDESLRHLWGTGGPGYRFPDELEDEYSYDRGIVAMANSGPNTNGSQFFVMLGDTPLPKAYSIFGRVTEGMDVVDDIAVGDVMTQVAVEEAAESNE